MVKKRAREKRIAEPLALTEAQAATVMTLFDRRESIKAQVGRDLALLRAAIEDLAGTYARQAELGEGEFEFYQAGPGRPVVLRQIEDEHFQNELEQVEVMSE